MGADPMVTRASNKRGRAEIQLEIDELVRARKPYDEQISGRREGTPAFNQLFGIIELFNKEILELNKLYFQKYWWG